MNSHFSQEPAAASSEPSSLDSSTLDTSNGTTTAKKSSRKGSKTESSMKPPSSAISEHSSIKGTPQAIRDWLTLSRRVSPVSLLASQGKDLEKPMSEICGLQPSSAFASYDPVSRCWRTFQGSLLTTTLEEYSETWPKAGIVQDGHVWELRTLEQDIVARDYGFLPTPTASSAGTHWNDTTRFDCLSSWMHKHYSPGDVNPQSWEEIMGWPIGYTDLKPLATDKFQSWLRQFGNS